MPRPRVSGIISQISGSTITVNAQEGNILISVLTNTVIQKTVAATQSDLAVGQEVTILGTADANSNIVASRISVRAQNVSFPSSTPPTGVGPSPNSRPDRPSGSPPEGFNPSGGGAVLGEIVAVNRDTITVADALSQQTTVIISSETTILETVIGNLSDLRVGDIVSVMGNANQSGNIQATLITVGSEGFGSFPLR